jgi:esterase/lipase superfamily enzyme
MLKKEVYMNRYGLALVEVVLIVMVLIILIFIGNIPYKQMRMPKANYTVVRVFYATDRNRTPSQNPSEMYGSGRAKISYGTCEVTIPRDHRMGKLEIPSIWRLEFRRDPQKHVVLLNISIQDKDKYFSELRACIRKSSKKCAFIFIHGYNETFENAARRTAQISYDLWFDGAPVFYSWPSQGTVKGYPVDETNIEWTQTNLKRFLDDFVAQTGAERIYLIAHSMGNRALSRAFGDLVAEKPNFRQRFSELILAAPDIDAEVFKQEIAPHIIGHQTGVTLYASSEDKALQISKTFHGYPRAGDSGSGLVVVSGIETIDATDVDTSFLGHSYFAESRSVLSDIFYLIRDGKRANDRFALKPVETPNGRYWIFKQ